jgi:hypothetical protein
VQEELQALIVTLTATMETALWIAGYCLVSLLIAALTELGTKRLWLLALASATASTLLLQAIVYVYLGFFDTWAYVVIVPSWLIALICAILYWGVARRLREDRASRQSAPDARKI